MSVALIGKDPKGQTYFYDDEKECFSVVPFKYEYSEHDTLLPVSAGFFMFVPIGLLILVATSGNDIFNVILSVVVNIALIILYLIIGHKSTAAEINKLNNCLQPQVIDLKTADRCTLGDLLRYIGAIYPALNSCFAIPICLLLAQIYLAFSSKPGGNFFVLVTIPYLVYGLFMWCALHMSQRFKARRKVKTLYRESKKNDLL